jgi:hypothetical protein
MKTRQWQARVTYPNGGIMTFGVQAASLPAAIGKACGIAAGVPDIADHLEVTRLYGRHHPMRRIAGRAAGR